MNRQGAPHIPHNEFMDYKHRLILRYSDMFDEFGYDDPQDLIPDLSQKMTKIMGDFFRVLIRLKVLK